MCEIRSTVTDDGKAACLLEWGPVRAALTPAVTLATARDLAAAAAAAEVDVALIEAFREVFKADDYTLALVLGEVRGRRPAPAGESALRIGAVAGAHTGMPYVHIARGSMKGELIPDEAREMALHWTEVAVAAQIDVRLRYALGEWGRLSAAEIDRLFTIVQEVGRADA
ncbi:hypothetical protein ABZX56_11055 [Streptomyces parvulus]|uniref:hypothetical protein n=1 Tax=Streptomyces parvulus TaxID=146923 RepID=UPI0033BB1DC4